MQKVNFDDVPERPAHFQQLTPYSCYLVVSPYLFALVFESASPSQLGSLVVFLRSDVRSGHADGGYRVARIGASSGIERGVHQCVFYKCQQRLGGLGSSGEFYLMCRARCSLLVKLSWHGGYSVQ